MLAILKNPAYAGAYVYGRSTHDPTRRTVGRPYSGIVHRPVADWPIVLRQHHPGYLTWEDFLANQTQLAANQARYRPAVPQVGAARKGQALPQGIALCGRCGAHMGLHYSGPQGTFPVYKCIAGKRDGDARACLEVRGLGLAALAPDHLAIALATLAQLEQDERDVRRQWQLRVERARYGAERARRRFDAVEPENRLRARTLERQWEELLRALEQVEQQAEAHLRQEKLV